MAQRFSAEQVSEMLPGYLPPDSPQRKCRQCQKVMRPEIEWRQAEPGEHSIRRYSRYSSAEVPVRVLWYGYGKEGFFCSLRCAYRYACNRVPY